MHHFCMVRSDSLASSGRTIERKYSIQREYILDHWSNCFGILRTPSESGNPYFRHGGTTSMPGQVEAFQPKGRVASGSSASALDFWMSKSGTGEEAGSAKLSARGRRHPNNMHLGGAPPLSARGINPEKHPELHNKEMTEMKRLIQLHCPDAAQVVSRTEIKCLHCNSVRDPDHE